MPPAYTARSEPIATGAPKEILKCFSFVPHSDSGTLSRSASRRRHGQRAVEEQIGCIHTCQGLEVDYIGVIVGPDLIFQDGAIVTRPEKRSRHDQSIKGYKKALQAQPLEARRKVDAIIKNTYRTLMTRGMKGCFVYFTDPQTAAYFRSRIANQHSAINSSPELQMVADGAED